jgi:hypothetical protein
VRHCRFFEPARIAIASSRATGITRETAASSLRIAAFATRNFGYQESMLWIQCPRRPLRLCAGLVRVPGLRITDGTESTMRVKVVIKQRQKTLNLAILVPKMQNPEIFKRAASSPHTKPEYLGKRAG